MRTLFGLTAALCLSFCSLINPGIGVAADVKVDANNQTVTASANTSRIEQVSAAAITPATDLTTTVSASAPTTSTTTAATSNATATAGVAGDTNKPQPTKDTPAGVGLSPISKVAEPTRPQHLPGTSQIVISLALVIALVLLLAFFYKKMQLKLPGHKHFRIVATLNIGQRERLLVIEIQGKQRVLGVTPQQINFLFDLETPLTEEKLASDFHTQLQSLLKK